MKTTINKALFSFLLFGASLSKMVAADDIRFFTGDFPNTGSCRDPSGKGYHYGVIEDVMGIEDCEQHCLRDVPVVHLVGVEHVNAMLECRCLYKNDRVPQSRVFSRIVAEEEGSSLYPFEGNGDITTVCKAFIDHPSQNNFVPIGDGQCLDSAREPYDFGVIDPIVLPAPTPQACQAECLTIDPLSNLRGIFFNIDGETVTCQCLYETVGGLDTPECENWLQPPNGLDSYAGSGPPEHVVNGSGLCYGYVGSMFEFVGNGLCLSPEGKYYDKGEIPGVNTLDDCQNSCREQIPFENLVGCQLEGVMCLCLFEANTMAEMEFGGPFYTEQGSGCGSGIIREVEPRDNTQCSRFIPFTPPANTAQTGGDPHFTTWNNEHYEYHGQCDLVMMNDPGFAGGLGLDIHIRTKIVRYWSYIKTVAIKIGNDILEIEGSADADDSEAHYWFNYDYQGEIDSIAGFPVTQKLPSVYKRQYKIDLSSKYPGQDIVVQIYKEFVRVKFNGGKEEVFGNTVGLLGDYKTGKTLARDGVTVMNDFTELGDEWQVLPSEPKLFHEVAHPQFPETCIKPEDPRGDRKRRLAESHISMEQAEATCETLKDPQIIKDCVYDILATQDLDMVGAF